jgi:hypothetical protein
LSRRTSAVHAQLAALVFHGIDKCLGGKLTALIRVDDLGCAVPPERFLKHIHGMAGFQGDRQFGRQDFATCNDGMAALELGTA